MCVELEVKWSSKAEHALQIEALRNEVHNANTSNLNILITQKASGEKKKKKKDKHSVERITYCSLRRPRRDNTRRRNIAENNTAICMIFACIDKAHKNTLLS